MSADHLPLTRLRDLQSLLVSCAGDGRDACGPLDYADLVLAMNELITSRETETSKVCGVPDHQPTTSEHAA